MTRYAKAPAVKRNYAPREFFLTGLYGIIFIYAAFFSFLRPLGAELLILVIGSTLTIFTLINAKFFDLRLLIFAAVAAVYALLSLTVDLHSEATALYSPAAIPQQVAYALILFFLVPAFAHFLHMLRQDNRLFLLLEKFVLAICVISIIWTELILQRPSIPTFAIGTLTNVHVLVLFILYRNISVFTKTFMRWGFFAALIVPAVAASLQTLIATFYYLLFLIAGRWRLAVLGGSLVLLILAIIAALMFPTELYELDANSGVRSWMWHAVIERVAVTGGVGVGFGTELVPPYLVHEGGRFVLRVQTEGSFLHIGAHNAFFDVYYRMGIIGVGIFLAYIGQKIHFVVRHRRYFDAFDYWAIFTLVLTLMVNVALVSFNFIFGTCMLLGWLTMREAEIRKQRAAARPAGITSSQNVNEREG
ncbi:hypothetical protein JYU02_01200 [bacterium AH-315-P15]|nr:hypothetical protein [bacterium AH-315-P15]